MLERCEPGTPLTADERPAEDRLRAAAAVLRDLWRVPVPDGLEELGAVLAEWADLAEERQARLRPGYDPGLVAYGVDLLRTLPGSAERRVILHGDANPGNFLAARRRPWLAIDPKPMVGDPAYDPWPLLGQVDDPFSHDHPARVVRDRIALLADELGISSDRIVAFCVARAVEYALYEAHHGRVSDGAAAMLSARTIETP